MHSIAFELFGRPIHWYGVCIAVGFLAALAVLQYKRDYAGMTKEQVFDIGIIAIFCGIGGARIFYVIQFHRQFTGDFLKVFRIDQGGLVFYGGFICALLALWIYSRVKKLSIARILDIYAPAIAIGHAFGRVGCFLEGCCYGKPVSWGVAFPPGSAPARKFQNLLPKIGETFSESGFPSLPLCPVQLFEAAANLLMCGFLLWLFTKVKKTGQIAAAYFACCGITRFLLEFLRGDHTDHFLGMTPAQIIGITVMLPCGLFFYLYFGKRGENVLSGEK